MTRIAPLAALILAACSNVNLQMPDMSTLVTPYRVDVRQGNFVTQEMVAQLRPGLTREQVRFILGSPLVADMFHADRWDYVYRFQPGRGEVLQRRLTVFFQDNKLTRVAGDVVAETASAQAPAAAVRMVEVPASATSADSASNPDKK